MRILKLVLYRLFPVLAILGLFLATVGVTLSSSAKNPGLVDSSDRQSQTTLIAAEAP